MTGAISFKIDEKNTAKIYPVGSYRDIDWNMGEVCPLGSDFCLYSLKNSSSTKKYVSVENNMAGEPTLRLLETKRYIVKIEAGDKDEVTLPRFQNEENKFLKLDKDESSVTFQFVNYLGHSKMLFDTGGNTRQIGFEIIPDKIDYEDDYIKMTESLAQACSELLLEYSGII